MTNGRDLYEKTLSLYKDRNKYAGDEYDSAKLPDIYYDSMFYYAFFTYYLINFDEISDAIKEVYRKQRLLEGALKTSSGYKGCKDDLKFRLLRGVFILNLARSGLSMLKLRDRI